MALIRGITITLYEKIEDGVDGFGRTIWREDPVQVDNVLVSPSQGVKNDIAQDVELSGKTAEYTLAIPKGDTHIWDDRTVEFFGQKWKTVGYATMGIESMIPLDWNLKVKVERFG